MSTCTGAFGDLAYIYRCHIFSSAAVPFLRTAVMTVSRHISRPSTVVGPSEARSCVHGTNTPVVPDVVELRSLLTVIPSSPLL